MFTQNILTVVNKTQICREHQNNVTPCCCFNVQEWTHAYSLRVEKNYTSACVVYESFIVITSESQWTGERRGLKRPNDVPAESRCRRRNKVMKVNQTQQENVLFLLSQACCWEILMLFHVFHAARLQIHISLDCRWMKNWPETSKYWNICVCLCWLFLSVVSPHYYFEIMSKASFYIVF